MALQLLCVNVYGSFRVYNNPSRFTIIISYSRKYVYNRTALNNKYHWIYPSEKKWVIAQSDLVFIHGTLCELYAVLLLVYIA